MKKLEPAILKIKLPQAVALLKIGEINNPGFNHCELKYYRLLDYVPERLQLDLYPLKYQLKSESETVAFSTEIALEILNRATIEEKEGLDDYTILLPDLLVRVFTALRKYAEGKAV